MPEERGSELLKCFSDYLNTRHKLEAKGKTPTKKEKEFVDSDFKENDNIKEKDIIEEEDDKKTQEVHGLKVSPEVLAITRGIEFDNKVRKNAVKDEYKKENSKTASSVYTKKEVKYIPPPKYITGFDKNERMPYVLPTDLPKKEPPNDEITVRKDSSTKKKTFMEKIVDEVLEDNKDTKYKEDKEDDVGRLGGTETNITEKNVIDNITTKEEGKRDKTENEKTTPDDDKQSDKKSIQAEKDLLNDILLKKSKKSLNFIDAIIAQESIKDKAVQVDKQELQLPTVSASEKSNVPNSQKCPVCNAEINSTNRLLICNDCGKRSCQKCEVYEKAHLKTNLYFEFKFDEPLCMRCYEKNFTIQKQLAKAYSCYGSGNYTYAYHYAMSALKIDPQSKYTHMINELIEKIEERKEESHKQDIIWKEKRKMLINMKAKKEKESTRDDLN